MKIKAFKRLVKLSAAILVLNQAVFLLSSASMALAVESTMSYKITQTTSATATTIPPSDNTTTTTPPPTTTATAPLPPIEPVMPTTNNTVTNIPNTAITDPVDTTGYQADMGTQFEPISILETSYSEPSSGSWKIYLFARTNTAADSMMFKIGTIARVAGTYDSADDRYEGVWDASTVPGGTYDVEAIVTRYSQTITKNFTISIDKPLPRPDAVASTTVNTAYPVVASTTTISIPTSTTAMRPVATTTTQSLATTTKITFTATTTKTIYPITATSTTTIRPAASTTMQIMRTTDIKPLDPLPMTRKDQEGFNPLPTNPVPDSPEEIKSVLPPERQSIRPESDFIRQPVITPEEKKEAIREFSRFIPIADEAERRSMVIFGSPEASKQAEEKDMGSDTVQAPRPINAIIVIDADGDGLPDEMEIRLGTSPINSDSDGDGYNDGEEVRNGYDPLGSGTLQKELKPVEKALAKKEMLEQPKLAKEAPISNKIKVAKVSNAVSSVAGNNGKNVLKFSGVAKPDDVVSIFIYSAMPIVVTVKTDSNGNWIYELDKTLVDGKHEAYVVINDENGKVKEKSSPFAFLVNEAQAVSNTIELPKADINVADNTAAITAWYAIGGLGLMLLTLLGFFVYSRKNSY